MDNSVKHVAIIGGGLVGALQACYLAQRGYTIDVYELRPDIRKQEVVRGRSINLAVSKRAREALAGVGMEEVVTKIGTPMYARRIHDLDGRQRSIPYGKGRQHIMSVDRRYLNEVLLTAAEKHSNVTMHFGYKLSRCDLDTGTCEFEEADSGTAHTATFDLIIGCDGAYSSMRRQVMRATRLDFSQEYIPHGYMELSIPAVNGKFALEENYLHIWARETFMMIALPNASDNSFVVTLFMPFAMFEDIKDENDLLRFFETTFPDSIPLIGREALIETYMSSKPLPMVSVKCSPYHVGSRAVLLGDAAHAMVPFYGQGMNCGFEDCIVFNDLLDKHQDDLSKVLPEFSVFRGPDAKAMCDLAMRNYVEMRSAVNTYNYLLRKKVDGFLNWLMPNTWTPLYTMVSFTRTRYSDCIRNREWQDKILSRVLVASGATALTGTVLLGGYYWRRSNLSTAMMDILTSNSLTARITDAMHKIGL